MRISKTIQPKLSPQDLFCNICQDTMKKVQMLWCNHAYCTDCINNYWSNHPDECPLRCKPTYRLGVTSESRPQILTTLTQQDAFQIAVTKYRKSRSFKKDVREQRRFNREHPSVSVKQEEPAIRFAFSLGFARSKKRDPILSVLYQMPITNGEADALMSGNNDELEVSGKILERQAGLRLDGRRVEVLTMGLLYAFEAVSGAYLLQCLVPDENGEIRTKSAAATFLGMVSSVCVTMNVLFGSKLV